MVKDNDLMQSKRSNIVFVFYCFFFFSFVKPHIWKQHKEAEKTYASTNFEAWKIAERHRHCIFQTEWDKAKSFGDSKTSKLKSSPPLNFHVLLSLAFHLNPFSFNGRFWSKGILIHANPPQWTLARWRKPFAGTGLGDCLGYRTGASTPFDRQTQGHHCFRHSQYDTKRKK